VVKPGRGGEIHNPLVTDCGGKWRTIKQPPTVAEGGRNALSKVIAGTVSLASFLCERQAWCWCYFDVWNLTSNTFSGECLSWHLTTDV
jgi:hypothetical protein